MLSTQTFIYLGFYGIFFIYLRNFHPKLKSIWWALINLSFVIFCFSNIVVTQFENLHLEIITALITDTSFHIFFFVLFISYLLIWLDEKFRKDLGLAYMAPILFLVIAKTLPEFAIVGASYLSFRLLYLRYEIRHKGTPFPSPSQFIEFTCFPLTFPMGPISPLRDHLNNHEKDEVKSSTFNILTRFLSGCLKLFYLSFIPLMARYHLYPEGIHSIFGIEDILLYGFLYYLYVYINFSGAADAIIAISQLGRLRVAENFNNPLSASNIQDFWMKWHMSLTNIIRELVFSPLYLVLKRKAPKAKWTALFISSLLLFLAVGLWHGISIPFILLGIYHGIGVCFYFLYKDWASRKIKLARNKTYYKILAILITQAFVSFSFIFFEASTNDLKVLFYRIFMGIEL